MAMKLTTYLFSLAVLAAQPPPAAWPPMGQKIDWTFGNAWHCLDLTVIYTPSGKAEPVSLAAIEDVHAHGAGKTLYTSDVIWAKGPAKAFIRMTKKGRIYRLRIVPGGKPTEIKICEK